MQPIITDDKGFSCRRQKLSDTLRRLWMGHVLWTRFFITSTAFKNPDIKFVTERLLQNPGDFAEVLRPFYGAENASRFKKLLTDHLLIAADLVNAAKAGDTCLVDKLRIKWYANAEDIARFLACLNPFWSEVRWRKMLFDHLKMTEDEAVFVLTGQFERSIKEYDRIQAQALDMADFMTNGIIKQFNIK